MISHPHQTIFVHIPKCGGQSVERAFLADLGLDWSNRAPLLLRPRVDGECAPPRLAHLKLQDYLQNHYVSQALFERYFKFAVVRCPYERVISFYAYLKLFKEKSLDEFVKEDLRAFLNPTHERYWFFQPQAPYLVGPDGGVGVDRVFFLERLASDWDALCQLANLGARPLPHVNQSRHRLSSAVELDAASKKIISALYEVDFDLLSTLSSPVGCKSGSA